METQAKTGLSGWRWTQSLPLAWRPALITLTAAVVAVIVVYFDTFAAMVSVWWRSSTFNHAFLIVPISGYLVWMKRHELAQMSPRPCWWGLIAIAVAGFVWFLGRIASVMAVEEFAAVGLIQATVFTVLGPQVTRKLAFPLFYLLFAVPFGEFVVPPLQDFTAVFVVKFLRLIDIPVFMDGVFISTPTGNFEVAETCAGARFLIATLALGTLFAHLMYRSRWRAAAFMGLAVIVPIIANGFRAFGIVVLAYYTNNKVAIGFDHIIYGWIFFALITLVLLYLGSRFSDQGPIDAITPPEHAPAPASDGSRSDVPVARQVLVVALVLVVLAGPALSAARIRGGAVDMLRAPIEAPANVGAWRLEARDMDDWRPVFTGVDGEFLGRYRNADDRRVDLYIGYYIRQRQGAELINSQNRLAQEETWQRAGGGGMELRHGGRAMKARFIRLLGRGRGRVVVYWYWVDGQFTASPQIAKLLLAKTVLAGGPAGAAVIAVSADYVDQPREAIEAIKAFLADAPPLDGPLAATGQTSTESVSAPNPDAGG